MSASTREARPPWNTRPGRDRATVLALTALATVAFGLFVSRRSLWFDEVLTVWAARLPPEELWALIRDRTANLGLYYLLMHGWTAVAGTGETAVRSVSVMFGVATIPVLAALARRLYGRPVTWLAPLLLILNAFFVSLAQEARPYAMLAFGATASSYLFVRGIESPTRRRWAVYALVTAAAVYVHAFAALIALAHAVSLALLPRDRIPWRHVAGSAVAGGILVAPLAVASVAQGGDLVSWVPPLSRGWALRFAESLAGNASPPDLTTHVHFALVSVLVAVGSVAALRTRPGGDRLARWREGFAVAWMAVPIGLVLAVSFVQPLLVDRYLVGSVPALALVAARGVTRFRPRAVRLAVGAAGVLTSAALVAALAAGPPKDDWRSAADHLGEAAAPGDAVYVSASVGLPGMPLPLISLDYYADREKPPVPGPLRPVESLLSALSAGDGPARLWVVGRSPSASGVESTQIRRALTAAGYRQTSLRLFPGRHGPIAVVGWVRAA